MTTIYNAASPGELLKEFLGDITATRLAEHIGVARATISRVLNGHTAVTTGRTFGWVRLCRFPSISF